MHKTYALLAGLAFAVASHCAGATDSAPTRDSSRSDAAAISARAPAQMPTKGGKESAKGKASVSSSLAVTKDPYATPLFMNARPLH